MEGAKCCPHNVHVPMHSNQENNREGPKSSTKKNGPIQLRSDAKFAAMHATESHVILWAFLCIQDKMRMTL